MARQVIQSKRFLLHPFRASKYLGATIEVMGKTYTTPWLMNS
jgi:hypothetical protein